MHFRRFVLFALVVALVSTAAPAQNIPSCSSYQGQILPCTGALSVDASGKPLLGTANSVSGTFTVAGTTTAPIRLRGPFNLSVGFAGTDGMQVNLERSFDAGVTWFVVHAFYARSLSGGAGSVISDESSVLAYGPTFSKTYSEPEASVWYRLNAVAQTSGTITYRLSQ